MRRLLLIIDNLPSHSRYVEAVLNDEEVISDFMLSKDSQAEGKPSIPQHEYDPTVRALAAIHDQLAVLNAHFIAANSKDKPKPVLYPRPDTALTRVTSMIRRKAHDSLVARVLPGRK